MRVDQSLAQKPSHKPMPRDGFQVGCLSCGLSCRDDVAVNPNDTEESIWAFLSEAQLQGPDTARENMLKVISVEAHVGSSQQGLAAKQLCTACILFAVQHLECLCMVYDMGCMWSPGRQAGRQTDTAKELKLGRPAWLQFTCLSAQLDWLSLTPCMTSPRLWGFAQMLKSKQPMPYPFAFSRCCCATSCFL